MNLKLSVTSFTFYFDLLLVRFRAFWSLISGYNFWQDVKKSSKFEQRTLISVFAQFWLLVPVLYTRVKSLSNIFWFPKAQVFFLVWVLRPPRRRACRGNDPSLKLLWILWGNTYLKFLITDIKFRFTCGESN